MLLVLVLVLVLAFVLLCSCSCSSCCYCCWWWWWWWWELARHKPRTFCHCDREALWRVKTSVALEPSSVSQIEADTTASQLRAFLAVCNEVQSVFNAVPPQLRSEIMCRMLDLGKLIQILKLSSQPHYLPLRCPDWQIHIPSLEMAGLMALSLSQGEEACEVQVSALHDANHIRINNTFGKRLVLRAGLECGIECQRLTLDHFRSGSWAMAAGRVAESETDWTNQLASEFFPESGPHMLSFPQFRTIAKSLLEQGCALVTPLGLRSQETFLADSREAWQRIVLHDEWHQSVNEAGQKSGVLMCQSLRIGGSAQVELQDLHIHGTTHGERTLIVAEDATVFLHGCRVSGSGNGVYFCNNASLTMRDTYICDCGSSGVVVANSSGPCHFENCSISANRNVGVAIGGPNVTTSSCQFKNTAIRENENHGISLFGGASATWCGPPSLFSGNGLGPAKIQKQPVQCRLLGFD